MNQKETVSKQNFEIGINWQIRVTSDLYTNLPIYPNFKMLDEAVKDETERPAMLKEAMRLSCQCLNAAIV